MNNIRSKTCKAIVISSGGSPGAFDIVRCLGMEGIKTTVASSHPHDIAFSSRHCGGRIILPPFRPAFDVSILKILEVYASRCEEQPVLYYASDSELSFVGRYRDELRQWFRFLLPENDVLQFLFNKVRFAEDAHRYNLPVPYTVRIRNIEELREHLTDKLFPCIVKPAFSQDWVWETNEQREKFGPYKTALRRFTTPDELYDFCKDLPLRPSGYLVQSYIDGRDESIVSFHGYFNERSDCVACFVGRKLRTYPAHTGGSTYIQTTYNPELARKSIDVLKQMKFQGVVKIDFKWDEYRGEFKMLEVNPRYNLWQVLGAYAGVNLAHIAYCHQRGEEVASPRSYANNTRFLYFKQDVRAYVNGYRKLKEWSMPKYLLSLVKWNHYRVFDVKDPIPFIVSTLGFLKRVATRIALRISPPKTVLRFGRNHNGIDRIPAIENVRQDWTGIKAQSRERLVG
ncbi:MAG: ATP-grasp domain-containing protein [Ignavibacteriales bacterium]|nr:ATP-grasp domain-containing protein [Ignavibacteriales bacterium]